MKTWILFGVIAISGAAHGDLYFGQFSKTQTETLTAADFLSVSDETGPWSIADVLVGALKREANPQERMFVKVGWWWSVHQLDREASPVGEVNDLASQKAAIHKEKLDRVLLRVHGSVSAVSEKATRMTPFRVERAVIRVKSEQHPDQGVEWNVTSILSLERDPDGLFGLRLSDSDSKRVLLQTIKDLGPDFSIELTLLGKNQKQEPKIAAVQFEGMSEFAATFEVHSSSHFCALMLQTEPLPQ